MSLTYLDFFLSKNNIYKTRTDRYFPQCPGFDDASKESWSFLIETNHVTFRSRNKIDSLCESKYPLAAQIFCSFPIRYTCLK